MNKSEQTDEVKARLYKLTLNFVRKYQPRLYYQFRGEQEDLASEFYTQFLTAKSREKGKEASLLDKYDSSVTSLEYLVKISVQRMLIDRSRADKYKFKSIDHFVDEFGDVIIKTFNLSTDDDEISVDELEFTPDFIELVRSKFYNLSFDAQKSLRMQVRECYNVLTPEFQKVFKFLVNNDPQRILRFNLIVDERVESCVCQQITDKTVCLLFNGQVYNFDRLTGVGRSKSYRQWHLTLESLQEIQDIPLYKSGFSREQIVNEFYLNPSY